MAREEDGVDRETERLAREWVNGNKKLVRERLSNMTPLFAAAQAVRIVQALPDAGYPHGEAIADRFAAGLEAGL